MTHISTKTVDTYLHRKKKSYNQALSLGIFSSLVMLNGHAAINDGVQSSPSSNDTRVIDSKDIDSKDDDNQVSSSDLTPSQLEKTLIALRLKQAVEKGTIDASVLEKYQKETLQQATPQSDAVDAPVIANTAITDADSVNQSELQAGDSNNSGRTSDSVQGNNNGQEEGGENNLGTQNVTEGDTAKDEFDTALQDAYVSPVQLQNNQSSYDTPEQIEQLLSDIQVNNIGTFSMPVARLDDSTPPLDLDSTLDDNTKIVSQGITDNNALYQTVLRDIDKSIASTTTARTQTPDVQDNTNRQVDSNSQDNRAIDDRAIDNSAIDGRAIKAGESPVSQNAKVASKTASTGQVSAGEDITDSDHPEFIIGNDTKPSDEVTGARIEQVQAQDEPILVDDSDDRNSANSVNADNLDSTNLDSINDKQPVVADANASIDPEDFLPEYESVNDQNTEAEAIQNSYETASKAEQDTKIDSEGFFKGLYNRLFNEGVSGLPRIDANVYIQDDNQVAADGRPVLIRADEDKQPMNNIKAAIENITVEAITDFPAAAPRLNEEALSAARAVGYYDIDLHFEQVSDSDVNIIIERLGEPVLVQNRVIDVRGEGAELDAFMKVENQSLPLEGDVLNHGAYDNTKFAIDSISDSYGFFDGEWLNTSVDVILPDDTADVDLIYDTRARYDFGNVVFYTLDKETGQLTEDPDQLPVKLALLHQLYDFESGEPYYSPLVTEFINDLSATNYFNIVNVDVVMPSENDATLTVVNESEDKKDKDAATNADIIKPSVNTDTSDKIIANTNKLNNADNVPDNAQTIDDSDIEPINFDVDQQTADKLRQIKAKAQRLSALPDDRVLGIQEEEARNFLGKISNAVSNIVKKILPDETDPFSNVDEDFEAPTLDGKITPQQVQQSKEVPIYVFVMADKPRDAQLGIGYGTDTGVRAVAQLEHNLLNKDGYQAGIRVGASDVRKTVNIEVSRPWEHPLDDTLHANLAYEQETIDQGEGNLDLRTDTIRAGIARNVRPPSGWDRTYSLNYRLDELESGVTGTNRADLPEPFNRHHAKFTQQSLLLGYAMHKVQSDNIADPTHGFSQYYSLEVGSDSVLTDTNMAIIRARLGTVQSFGEADKHQIVANLDTGYIWADNFNDVPYKQRFFAGGDRSLRGYDYNSLSALDRGYLVGGQVLALGSMEYNYEFKPKFRGAVFADVGNAYDEDFTTETKLGVGAGIRWSSPIGLVRLDVAAGVLEDSIPVRLHLFIGSPLQ